MTPGEGLWRRWTVAALLLSFLGVCAWGADQTSVETKRKAVFIGKLLRFVEWPGVEAGEQRPKFQFCVAGDSFMSFAISEEVHGTTVRGRAIEVRTVWRDMDVTGCEALYLAESAKGMSVKWLQKVKGTRVLTLGEERGFLEAGGMVQITCRNDLVQFKVNLQSVRSGGLKIDARLLELAKGVTQGGKAAGEVR